MIIPSADTIHVLSFGLHISTWNGAKDGEQMTRKEAIWILENRDKDGNLTGMVGGYKELLDFCFEALKQQESQEDEIYDNLEGYAEKVEILGEPPVWVHKPAQTENLQTDWKPHDSDRYYCAMIDGMIEEDDFCRRAERRRNE